MNPRKLTLMLFAWFAAAVLLGLLELHAATDDDAADEPRAVRVAVFKVAEDPKTCFSDGFLVDVDRKSNLSVHRALIEVPLGDRKMYEHPLAIFSGEKGFQVTEDRARALALYLKRGGMLIGSANCGASAFDRDFRKLIAAALPEAKFQVLDADHPLFTSLYEINKIRSNKPHDRPLEAIVIDDRLAVLYTPIGLSDSRALAFECCCCGSNEILNARQINANALVYAVTR